MSISAYDRRFITAASGTTVGALFYQIASTALSAKTVSGSAAQRTAGITTILSPEELEEREWNRLLATPESNAFLDMLEEEALRDYREGRTEEGGFGRD